MEMEGSRALAVTQQQAWDALNDPAVLKTCIPGCERLEPTGENQYSVGTALKIGPMQARFAGKVVISDILAPNSYTLQFDGQGGAAGFGKGLAHVRLSPALEGSGCTLAYEVKAQVGGKIAQLGQRLIDGVAKSMADDFFKRFEEEMARRYPATPKLDDFPDTAGLIPPRPAATNRVAPAPSSAGVPAWVWLAGAAVIVGAVVMLMR